MFDALIYETDIDGNSKIENEELLNIMTPFGYTELLFFKKREQDILLNKKDGVLNNITNIPKSIH